MFKARDTKDLKEDLCYMNMPQIDLQTEYENICKEGFKGSLEDYIEYKNTYGKDKPIRKRVESQATNENVDHPSHYGGKDNPYEAIKVIEAWLGIEGLKGFCLGNALKYISRAGKKDGNSEQQDMDKAIWYIDYYNARVKELSERKS